MAPGATRGDETFTGKIKPAEAPVRKVVLATGAKAESGASEGAAHSSIVNPGPESGVPE